MEVLYSLDLTSERGLDLVLLANKLKRDSVQRVTTRAEAKKAALVESEEALVVSEEQPSARPIEAVLSSNVASSSAGSSSVASSQKSDPQSIESVGSSSKGSELMSLDVCRGKGDLAVILSLVLVKQLLVVR